MNTEITFIDSHCHLQSIDLTDFNDEVATVLEQAADHGVMRMLCVCIEPKDIPTIYKLTDTFKTVYSSVGVHPNTPLIEEPDAMQLVKWAEHESCVAIGETGLDYFRLSEENGKEKQRARFKEHIKAALVSQKPLIIHTREAADDTMAILKEEQASAIGGVIHCFTETWEVAKRALDLGFYISFSGIVTFKNAKALQEVAKKVPLDRLLIETDAPYLAPVPYRGKQNHPALVKYVAECLSNLKGLSINEIAGYTSDNFYRCFRITPHD